MNPYNRGLLSTKVGPATDTPDNTDGKIITLYEKSQSQNCTWHDSTYIKFRNCKLIFCDINHFSSYVGLGMDRERQQKVTKKLLSDENILYLNKSNSYQNSSNCSF